MTNTTTTQFWKGQLYTRKWMDDMTGELKKAKLQYGFKVVGGGAGAWQWLQHPEEAEAQGIDTVFEGYFEDLGPQLFLDLLEGKDASGHVLEKQTAIERIRPLRGGSMLGVVEISRGCGKACEFCTLAYKKMGHLPVSTIMSDIEANVHDGIGAVVSGSEDFFRYGGKGMHVNFQALHDLLTEMRKIKGLRFMQIDHANISSVLQLTEEQLKEVRRLLAWEQPTNYLWVNMGVESANGWLVHANGKGKMAPFSPDHWEDMVKESADRMTRTGFFSVFSVILGLPGETPDDVKRTLKLVRYLSKKRAVVFPIFHEPVLQKHVRTGSRFALNNMRLDHLELYTTCYEINFKWVPRLYWDNQRAGGVPWLKRSLVQALGRIETHSWRRNFRRTRKHFSTRATPPPIIAEPISNSFARQQIFEPNN